MEGLERLSNKHITLCDIILWSDTRNLQWWLATFFFPYVSGSWFASIAKTCIGTWIQWIPSYLNLCIAIHSSPNDIVLSFCVFFVLNRKNDINILVFMFYYFCSHGFRPSFLISSKTSLNTCISKFGIWNLFVSNRNSEMIVIHNWLQTLGKSQNLEAVEPPRLQLNLGRRFNWTLLS